MKSPGNFDNFKSANATKRAVAIISQELKTIADKKYASIIDLALSKLLDGQYQPSLELFERAISCDSSNFSGWLGKAICQIILSENEEYSEMASDLFNTVNEKLSNQIEEGNLRHIIYELALDKASLVIIDYLNLATNLIEHHSNLKPDPTPKRMSTVVAGVALGLGRRSPSMAVRAAGYGVAGATVLHNSRVSKMKNEAEKRANQERKEIFSNAAWVVGQAEYLRRRSIVLAKEIIPSCYSFNGMCESGNVWRGMTCKFIKQILSYPILFEHDKGKFHETIELHLESYGLEEDVFNKFFDCRRLYLAKIGPYRKATGAILIFGLFAFVLFLDGIFSWWGFKLATMGLISSLVLFVAAFGLKVFSPIESTFYEPFIEKFKNLKASDYFVRDFKGDIGKEQLILTLEDEKEIVNPSNSEILNSLKFAEKNNSFLILGKPSGPFIQAVHRNEGFYVEFSEEGVGRLKTLIEGEVGLEDCFFLFSGFSGSNSAWKESKQWVPAEWTP